MTSITLTGVAAGVGVADRFGRRPVVLVIAIVLVTGAVLSVAAVILFVGRLLVDIAIGGASMLARPIKGEWAGRCAWKA